MLEKDVDPDQKYPGNLPAELEPFYCYTLDGGHSIIIVLENLMKEDNSDDLDYYLVPAPVKTVIETGYRVENGYVFCSIPYSSDFGLMSDPDDDEF